VFRPCPQKAPKRSKRITTTTITALNNEHSYGRWRAYSQSKLANALFAVELDRGLRVRGSRQGCRAGILPGSG
jgi:NAD(P)-dependent dehydrogenase (short-subunit alcohol dehydrogenase family)